MYREERHELCLPLMLRLSERLWSQDKWEQALSGWSFIGIKVEKPVIWGKKRRGNPKLRRDKVEVDLKEKGGVG